MIVRFLFASFNMYQSVNNNQTTKQPVIGVHNPTFNT